MTEKLNKQQKEAIKNINGPLLVLAGAGSGKTKVLTLKVANLIENGIDPGNILAITFTNKAANEMKSRIFDIVGKTAYQIQISTFHSFGLSIIRDNFSYLGLKSNFTILDSEDVLTVIKKILKDMNLDPKYYNPKVIRNQISSAKNEIMDPLTLEKYANTDIDNVVVEVYKKYQDKLQLNNCLDFDDLLMFPIILFRSNSEILKRYQEKYKYILIDEYQDTNEVQYELTKLLASKYKNICVVGDQDQSIYAFRGANYKNILNFEKDYNDSKTIMLEQNYRSTQNILNAANDVIKNNKKRKDKNLWTNNGEGNKITYKRCMDEKQEASFVASEIIKLVKNGEKLENIAVLYRTNAQSRGIEESMLKQNIPYKVVGSFYFYNRKEIKDLISYLKLIHNTNDDINLIRVINTPKRGIGSKTIENLTLKASLLNQSIFDTIDSGKELSFKNLILELIKNSESLSLTELVDEVLDKSGIKKELEQENTIEAQVRLENLEEFKSITKSYEDAYGIISLEEFLNEISLVSDIEEHKNTTQVVTLMTVHSAKGLEFDNVFIIGMEEGVFPHIRSINDLEQLEEERRLCYVAITRAKKNLTLVNATTRMLFGSVNSNPVSRFIKEINENYLQKLDFIKKDNNHKFKRTSNINTNEEYIAGQKVIHNEFGEGVIITVENKILTIAFSHPYGIKKIIKGHKSIVKK